MEEEIINVNNLGKTYHSKFEETKAVDNICFNLKNGEFVAIIGPSGCGKSTILSILCGLEDKSCGKISIKEGKSIGYMLQTDCLFEWRTILDNCLLGLEIKKRKDNESIQFVKNLLITYGLGDFMNCYPSSLSGGMRQRVALIRTLATKPDILLMDEPFSALDYQTRLAVSDDVFNIIKNEGKSAIIVTHDISEAISMADRIYVLTKRPAKIKKVFDIVLSNKSNPICNRKSIEFAKYYDDIWKEIDHYV